jgi:mono/diheme cytochrome c family protein
MQKKWLVALPVCALLVMAAQTKPAPKKAMENGKKVYDMYCLACHQADGTGVPRLNPPVAKTSYVLGDKKKLVQIILKGMNEPVEINGNIYENVMAPHDYLTDQEIADVLTYVRNSFGNKASVVTAAEVKKIRALK